MGKLPKTGLVVTLTLSTVQELSEFLHKSPATIYSDSIRRPESLPPIVRIPGTKKLLFANAEEWASKFILVPEAKIDSISQPRRRGAPTKAEKIALERETKNGVGK